MNTSRLSQSYRFAPALWALAVVCLFSFLPGAALAQGTGTISGRILNQGTGEYLRNANVEVVGTQISTVAEAGGNYTLPNVPAGPVRIAFKYAGLDTQEIPVVVTAGQTVIQNVSLTNADYDKGAVKLGEFVVASEKEGSAKVTMEQKNSIEAKRVLAADSFGTISEGNVGEFLKYLPGVVIDYVEADARSVSLGGLDPKYTAVTLDGAPIASSGRAAADGSGANRAFEFEQISISSVEAVELNRTPQPENPGNAMAGGINLRSRSAFDRAGRQISLRAGFAFNSLSGNPFKEQAGWDDESHYRAQPNWAVDFADVFLGGRLGILAGYNYSYTFAEQKAVSVTYAFDTDRTNNATEIPRVTAFTFRDSPKPTVRYSGNFRADYKVNNELWFSARAGYNRYHAKFFSRDLNINFNTTANSPDPDGTGTAVAGPVVAGAEYSLSSQTATVGSVGINQGGGATNKYGSTANFGLDGHFQRGAFRLDLTSSMSRSQTWYKDQLFGFFWSINPNSLGNLGLRFNRNGPSDPGVSITQLSGPDYRNLANHPLGFSATTNDRQGEDQRYQVRADSQYSKQIFSIPTIFKFGANISQWVNNSDRPVNGYSSAFRGKDGVAASADENLALFAEPTYRMNFDFGGNVDGLPNVDRWAVYKLYQENPSAWTPPTQAQIVGFKLQNARDAQEQIDALYEQTVFKLGKFTIAPGVRLERTRGRAAGPSDLGQRESDRRIFGNVRPGDPIASGGLGLPAADVTAVRQSALYLSTRYGGGRQYARQEYNTWLRYLHGTYRFTENLVAKASWNQAISRPDMNRLIGGLVITNDDPNDPAPNRATAGNSSLVPETSETINLSLEYYTSNVGELSVALYRRDIKNLLRSVTYLVPAGGSFNGEPLPTTVSPEDWEISTQGNVGRSHMSSAEFSIRRQLSFLPGPLSRSRVDANWTVIRYDDYDNFFRPTKTANLSWNIRYNQFTFRWNTNWTPGYRREAYTASNGWPNFNRERLTHTVDFNWKINRRTDFFINGRNVLNQDDGTYRSRSDLRTRWVQTGAIWATGVQISL